MAAMFPQEEVCLFGQIFLNFRKRTVTKARKHSGLLSKKHGRIAHPGFGFSTKNTVTALKDESPHEKFNFELIKEWVKDKKIVALGESTHGIIDNLFPDKKILIWGHNWKELFQILNSRKHN